MESKIRFVNKELKKAFQDLEDNDQRLYKEINKALRNIKRNAFHGRAVKKKLIPEKLIKKYDIDNLWIYNLRKDWRLLYTVGGNEVKVIAVILDWMDHKDYEKLFNF